MSNKLYRAFVEFANEVSDCIIALKIVTKNLEIKKSQD